MLTQQDLELGLEPFVDLVLGDERAARELEASRAEFFADPTAARLPGAERRHLEWFLLERPSAAVGGVPVQVWQSAWRAALPDAAPELAATFLQSLAGAFEVTSLVPGEGLWVRDLFTQGEHPILEARASRAIELADLLVGRLFPAGGGAFLLSPAASVFRNAELLAAVRSDLAAMRSARRGVLRVQQLELEHLFHGPGSVAAVPPDPAQALAHARAALRELGVAPEELERALSAVRRARRAGDGRTVIEVLNHLAFETGIDLDAARLVLTELWESLPRAAAPVPGVNGAEPPVPETRAEADARAALEAFDRGRAQGKDLEQLFRELERDLGVDDEELAEEPDEELLAAAPDFPGVVGAMVEEYLWELGREQGEARAHAAQGLRELGSYAHDIGVFDELTPVHLTDFAARWLLDEQPLARAEDAGALLDALADFCRWSEERQGVPLWKPFAPTLESLRASLPRHLRLRTLLAAGAGEGAHRVVHVGSAEARVRDPAGTEHALALSREQAELLRAGDLVRLARRNGEVVLGASYPAELANLLG